MTQLSRTSRAARGMWWDRAWSLVSGCSYVSDGCDHCWAANEAHIRAGQANEKIKARYGGLTRPDGRWNGTVRLNCDTLDIPFHVKTPKTWAVWNDLFHEDVPFNFIREAYARMGMAPQHTYIILTKRADRMLEFLQELDAERDFYYDHWTGDTDMGGDISNYPNVIHMVTAENQERADKRIPYLLQCNSRYRGVSIEPMLGPINLRHMDVEASRCKEWCQIDALSRRHTDMGRPCLDVPHLDWVICGGESGPGARPLHPDWVRSLRDQCQAAEVPFFFKQWGEFAQSKYPMGDIDRPEWANEIKWWHTVDSTDKKQIGTSHPTAYGKNGEPMPLKRVGKQAAGRLLDGREWNEFPEVKA